ncbi:PhoX family phosphatase [Ammoniphilus sp. CFH 90114]|uniref:PhoX family protein n=1 Tax=Ammoniphilus sp. CFH 90114 TaxID=2493665 RepID=UPI00100FD19B|nr:alkaline phosphatase PhoX [Ammoniphilus sp. CFH 90114]RXT04273.1 DUF839 domain-containing protein [Ammoniphilus sp. CFH 90114]
MKENKQVSRRKFLTYLGAGAASLALSPGSFGLSIERANAYTLPENLFKHQTSKLSSSFHSILATNQDQLVVPQSIQFDVVAAYGDVINSNGDTYGFNNGYTCFFPIEGSSNHGLLWVSHESTNSLWVEGQKEFGHYSLEQKNKLLYNQGGSIIEVYRNQEGAWKMDKTSPYARRITGLDAFQLTGPARGARGVHGGSRVQGTFAGGAGGKTLWNTVLSCEKNIEATCQANGFDATHYGWIVEIDPFNLQAEPVKHTALGRIHHSFAAMDLTKDQRIVVYMGDDTAHSCLFKFISKGKYDKSRGKDNKELLTDGTLLAANLEEGKWIELTIEDVKKVLNDHQYTPPASIGKTRTELIQQFNEQADILIYAHEAALLLGATATDRLIDVTIHPKDRSIFIAHAHNFDHGNLHGQIAMLVEKNADLGAREFEFEQIVTGGKQAGFSSPSNLVFDSKGNLWITTTIPSDRLNKGMHASFKNNGLFVITNKKENLYTGTQFASAPVEAELNGLTFSPNEQTLFLTIQHPGELSKSTSQPTSMWPHRMGDNMPRPALVALRGF